MGCLGMHRQLRLDRSTVMDGAVQGNAFPGNDRPIW